MSDTQNPEGYYCFVLTLKKEFFKWINTHRLLYGPGEFQESLLGNQPEEQQFNFGGKYGTQFKTLRELQSFDSEFDKLLKDNKIDSKHKHPLLYMMTFLGTDLQKQSSDINTYNHLLDYSRFLLDLISDSLAHIETMRKNTEYQEVHDVFTNEIFFAKSHLVESLPYEELIEYSPEPKQANDVVKYLRITFYNDELYVPNDIIISIQSKNDRKLKSYEGTNVFSLQLPANLKYEVFTFMVRKMLDDHKRYDTEFYQAMMKGNTLSEFRDIVNKNKKHTISNVISLVKVGTLVTDYLFAHKIFTSKRSIAGFLFGYFALFKAIIMKRHTLLPDNYDELKPFYIKNRINAETIRNMMKDVGDI